jgi:hypothetical protein
MSTAAECQSGRASSPNGLIGDLKEVDSRVRGNDGKCGNDE